MKLKDTLPTAPLLLKIHSKNGTQHQNYVEMRIALGNDAVHIITAHYTDFLPSNHAKLKERVSRFVNEIFVANPDGSPLSSDQIRQTTDHIFNTLMDEVRHSSDIRVVEGSEPGSIQNVTVTPALAAAEADLRRRTLPILARNVGVLLEAENGRDPQILLTDTRQIAPLVPEEWGCGPGAGYSAKFNGERTDSACDAIFIGIGGAPMFDKYNTHASGMKQTHRNQPAEPEGAPQELEIVLATHLLGHEIAHHTGIDTLAQNHAAELDPLLLKDIEFNQRLRDGIMAMSRPKTTKELVKKIIALGMQDPNRYEPLMIATAAQYPQAAEQMGTMLEQVYENTRVLIETLRIRDHSFAAKRGNYSIADELIPSLLSLQALNGPEWARAAFPNTYPALERIMRQQRLEITQSITLPPLLPDPPPR